MERRVLATIHKQWSDCDASVASPPIPYGEYSQPEIIDLDRLLEEMVGQVDRIEKYPSMGYTVEVDIPDEVARSKSRLMELGFGNHLVP